MIALVLLYRAGSVVRRALIDVCLFVLFLFGLLFAAVWRWA
ncbi:hypothetical protein VLK31_28370 [Variovorax sp. H27-G14]